MKNSKHLLIFGRKGKGKTTLAVWEMVEALKKGQTVYSNIDINWFGDLYLIGGIELFFNKIYNLIHGREKKRKKTIENLDYKIIELEEIVENIIWTIEGDDKIPDKNPTTLYLEIWKTKKKLNRLKQTQKHFENGRIISHWYKKENFIYVEDLAEAIQILVKDAKENPKNNYMLCWDEGFVDLEHGNKPPKFITAFFNEARKISVDIIACSQRPVAIYPSFRALCDFMIKVDKKWFFGTRFVGTKFYVDDDANALPNLAKDYEGVDKGEHYRQIKGSEVFGYFNTRQGIGLKKLFEFLE